MQNPGLTGNPSVSFAKNNVKINLSSLLLNNYSFSYERSVSKKISVVAGYRFMPETVIGSMALTRNIVENMDVDADIRNNLDNFRSSNQAYTGEVRLYSGKKPGARGLYVSLYGRYTNMRYDVDIQKTYDEKEYNIPIRSNVAGIGAGLMFGSQWLIAKKVVLDWYIIGGHYGKLTKGEFTGTADLSELSAQEKQDLEEQIEELGIIGSNKYIEAEVNDNGARATVTGPFLGIRGFGINLGYAF
jgi:hypothetical protein